MKTLISIATIGLAAFGFASSASAGNVHFVPNGAFSGSGSVTVTAGAVSLPCTTTLSGTAAGGGAHITSVSFSGVSCLALTASGLPWKLHAKQINKFVIKKVTVSAVVLGICGPGKITATLSNGLITISGAGLPGVVPCSVSGTVQTTPHLAIAHD